jgi:hypothetical protein
MSDEITPFRIGVPDADLDDLRERLGRTRWPEPETVDDWSQGTSLAYIRDLCGYWLKQYDWRAAEARLNRFPQFRTEIDGLDIHFIHVRSPHDGAVPLIMTHGWPGSIVEFHKVIEPLTDPAAYGGDAADAFHVVCPSLPGYGFSGKPAFPAGQIRNRSSHVLGHTHTTDRTARGRLDNRHLGIEPHRGHLATHQGRIDITRAAVRWRREDEMGWHVARQRGTRPDVMMGISGRLAQK